MPFAIVTNHLNRRTHIRHAGGLKPVASGASTPPLEMAESLLRYYERAGFGVARQEKADDKPNDDQLDGMDADALRAIADGEHVELGDVDLSTDDGRTAGVAIIREFRRVYESGTADNLRAAAEADGVDLAGIDSKYGIVNAMLAHRGVAA